MYFYETKHSDTITCDLTRSQLNIITSAVQNSSINYYHFFPRAHRQWCMQTIERKAGKGKVKSCPFEETAKGVGLADSTKVNCL